MSLFEYLFAVQLDSVNAGLLTLNTLFLLCLLGARAWFRHERTTIHAELLDMSSHVDQRLEQLKAVDTALVSLLKGLKTHRPVIPVDALDELQAAIDDIPTP